MRTTHTVLEKGGARGIRRERSVQGASRTFMRTRQLSAVYDPVDRAVWLRMHPGPRPCFNPELLDDLKTYCDRLHQSNGHLETGVAGTLPIHCAILASGISGVFNLGGDLSLFTRLIETRDEGGLVRYGQACVDVVYRNYTGHGVPLRTVSLVQGECLGGGFEAALSSDLVVAERSSRFGFPEVIFNLFPGMGACSFLERRVGRRKADSILASGNVFSAEEMYQLGVIDKVVADGTGEAAVRKMLGESRHMQNGLVGLAQARRRIDRISQQELDDVVRIWAQRALQLTPRDLRLMSRLVTRQDTILLAG